MSASTKKPNWKQPTPLDQLVALQNSLFGDIDNILFGDIDNILEGIRTPDQYGRIRSTMDELTLLLHFIKNPQEWEPPCEPSATTV